MHLLFQQLVFLQHDLMLLLNLPHLPLGHGLCNFFYTCQPVGILVGCKILKHLFYEPFVFFRTKIYSILSLANVFHHQTGGAN